MAGWLHTHMHAQCAYFIEILIYFIYLVSNGENDIAKEAEFSYMQSPMPQVNGLLK